MALGETRAVAATAVPGVKSTRPPEYRSLLRAAERALSEGRIEQARRAFELALAEEETAEVHEGLGWAAMWLEERELSVRSFEAAHRLYVARGDVRGAGRTAVWLAYSHASLMGEPAVASGWGERAGRLLADLEPGPEHVWLVVGAASSAMAGGDTVEVRRLARRSVELARRLGRPDLEAVGLALEGRALVTQGDVAAGMSRLDEAAATAMASATSDFACVGQTCCTMLAACELTGDIERASEWSDRTSDYARRLGFRSLFAICRASYAGVLIWRGRWQEAEAELVRSASELATVRPAARGQALVRLADLRRRQGRFSEAEALLAQVDGSRAAVLGCAALALDRGDAEQSRDLAERYLRQTSPSDRAERATALHVLVNAHVRVSALEAAGEALDALQSTAAAAPTGPLRALSASAAGSVAAARGDAERARECFEDAVDLFHGCGAPYEATRARLDLASVLRACGRQSTALREARAAAEAFERLGASRGHEEAMTLVARLEEPSDDDRGERDLGLTRREREVLAAVAAGLTSRQIAERLVISEHTVHRHLTNLYRKLDVSSRAAATAYAHRHGLV